MRVVVVEAPQPVVTLDRAKQHLRVDGIDDDALIEGYIAAATGMIDGPTGWLGRTIGRQTLEAAFAIVNCRRVTLPYPPVVRVDAVTLTREGIAMPIAASRYSVAGETVTFRDLVTAADDMLTVRYQTGYEVVPPPIVAAILLITGELYAKREGEETSFTAAATLLQPFRVYR